MAKERIRRRVVIHGKTQWITGSTEQEYAENLFKAMGGASTAQKNHKHDFRQFADDWFQVFSKPNIDRTTAVTYERQLRLYIYPAFEGLFIEDLLPADVQRLFNSMDAGQPQKAKATKQKVKTVLNMIFQQAIEDGLIVRNPLTSKSIRIKGAASQVTKLYSVEQMQYIAAHIADVVKCEDRRYIALQALHPLRLEEVLGLRWKDIDLENGIIHVRNTVTHPTRNQPVFAEKTKTDASRRRIRLVEQIQGFLMSGALDSFVVGGKEPLSYQQVRRMCERIQKDIGFNERITPQRFRTTVLTDLYDATKDIKQAQAAAGHTTAAMTLKHYVQGREKVNDTAAPIASVYGLVCDRPCDTVEGPQSVVT